jgi:hypothetical protein
MRKLILLPALLALLVSCGGGGEKPFTESKNAAVCVWDNVSLKGTPEEAGKWLSAISVGETVLYLKETATDETGKKPVNYIKVRLKDSKEGWVQSDFVILESRPAAIIDQTPIYSRPDLLNKTDKFFGQMDIVAVKSESNGFIEVAGKRTEGKWIETAWIKDQAVTYADVDIAVAKFAKKALEIKDEPNKIKALNEITDNPDLKESIFISRLIVDDEVIVEEQVEETIEEGNEAETE